MTSVADAVQRFEDFELDRAAYELRRQGRPVRLEGLAMNLLMLLLERPGELVTRAEIIERLWGSDAFIDVESGINTAVRKLRSALRDSAEAPKIVRTVQGKGYSFIATLDVASAAPTAATHPGAEGHAVWRQVGWARIAASALAVVAVMALIVALAPRPPAVPRVQVMALSVLGGGASARGFADRLGEQITGVLNETGVQTTPLPKSFFPSFRPPPPDLVFRGSVSEQAGALRARIFLEDVQADLVLWTREFTGRVGQEGELADQAAAAASETIYMALDTQRQKGVLVPPEAVALFVRGGEKMKRPSPLDPGGGRRAFERVVQLAPDFALGHSWLANASALEAPGHPEPERSALQQRAEAEARRAIAIDRRAGIAYSTLGLLAEQRRPGDIAEVVRQTQAGLRADPDYPFLSMRMCDLLTGVGRFNEGLWYCRRAVALRPMASPIAWKFAENLEWAGDHATATQQAERSVRFDPDLFVVRLVRLEIALLGPDADDARPYLHDPARAPRGLPPDTVAAADLVLKAKATKDPTDVGRASRALIEATQAAHFDINLAVPILAQLGRQDDAFDLLQRAPLESMPGGVWGILHPAAAGMRSDPRFWTAAERLELVRFWRTTNTWPDFCSAPDNRIDCHAMAEQASRAG